MVWCIIYGGDCVFSDHNLCETSNDYDEDEDWITEQELGDKK